MMRARRSARPISAASAGSAAGADGPRRLGARARRRSHGMRLARRSRRRVRGSRRTARSDGAADGQAEAAQRLEQVLEQLVTLEIGVGAVDLARRAPVAIAMVDRADQHDLDLAQTLVALHQLADLEAEHLGQAGVEHHGPRQRALDREDRLDTVVDQHRLQAAVDQRARDLLAGFDLGIRDEHQALALRVRRRRRARRARAPGLGGDHRDRDRFARLGLGRRRGTHAEYGFAARAAQPRAFGTQLSPLDAIARSALRTRGNHDPPPATRCRIRFRTAARPVAGPRPDGAGSWRPRRDGAKILRCCGCARRRPRGTPPPSDTPPIAPAARG